MVAVSPVLYFGIFGLFLANQVYTSCVSEENLSKRKKETSCIQLSLTSVPMKEIPPDTGILILSFNNLKAISTSTFKGMKELVELDLSDNALTSFKVDLPIMLEELNLANNSLTGIPDLSQLSSLTRLVLTNNRISTVSDSAFKGLNGLKMLELQKNSIHSLSGEVFNDLKSLDLLDLSYNQLWELSAHLISGPVSLKQFYLTGNKLTNIPDKFFDGLDSLAYVYLDKNPWICNCALQYLKDWMEDNGHIIYYLSNGTPVGDEKSVLCSDGTPLIDYDMPDCSGKGLGDADQHFIPTKFIPIPKKTTQAQSTIAQTPKPWKTTKITTVKITHVLTTRHPTLAATTSKIKQLTTPIVTSTKLSTTTPTTTTTSTTRKITTTPYKTIIMTTTEKRTTTLETTEMPSSTHPTTTFHTTSTLPTLKVAPSTVMATSTVSTQKHPANITHMPTSAKVTEALFRTTDTYLFFTMPPARVGRAEAHGMSWLEYKILKNCCFLHLILYIVGLLLLLAEIILTACLLVWTHTHLYRHYQALMEKMPNIRLIRYSLRAPVNEDEILLVRDIENNFSDQSLSGVTRMLVLEANTRDQKKLYTSAIL
ncbi:platelet glycoprotein Ib alpha chain [Pyxicephalus adspersus]